MLLTEVYIVLRLYLIAQRTRSVHLMNSMKLKCGRRVIVVCLSKNPSITSPPDSRGPTCNTNAKLSLSQQRRVFSPLHMT